VKHPDQSVKICHFWLRQVKTARQSQDAPGSPFFSWSLSVYQLFFYFLCCPLSGLFDPVKSLRNTLSAVRPNWC